MGVDYTTSIVIGRMIEIYEIDFVKYEQVVDKFEDLDITISRQEYKGEIICTGIFVGKFIHRSDPRTPKPIQVGALLDKLYKDYDVDAINNACDYIKNELGLDTEFSDYGVHSLVECF